MRSFFFGLLLMITLVACGNINSREDVRLFKGVQEGTSVVTSTPDISRALLTIARLTPTSTIIIRASTLIRSPSQSSPAMPFTTSTPTRLPSRTPNPLPTPTPDLRICSPLATIKMEDLPKVISEPYHPPPPGLDDRHQGVDFAYFQWKGGGPILGVDVRAVLAGRVAAALVESFPYGNLVILETPFEGLSGILVEKLKVPPNYSLYTLYAHLQSPPLVSLGKHVGVCQVIGHVGRSGNAEVPHLHFETRMGPPGASFTELNAHLPGMTREQEKNYRLWRTSGIFQHFDPMLLLLMSGLTRYEAIPTIFPPTSAWEE